MHENHPVINLLRINKSMVGVDVDEQQKMDGYVKVTNSLFDASCDAIQNRILDKIQTHDFNNLTVGLCLRCLSACVGSSAVLRSGSILFITLFENK